MRVAGFAQVTLTVARRCDAIVAPGPVRRQWPPVRAPEWACTIAGTAGDGDERSPEHQIRGALGERSSQTHDSGSTVASDGSVETFLRRQETENGTCGQQSRALRAGRISRACVVSVGACDGDHAGSKAQGAACGSPGTTVFGFSRPAWRGPETFTVGNTLANRLCPRLNPSGRILGGTGTVQPRGRDGQRRELTHAQDPEPWCT